MVGGQGRLDEDGRQDVWQDRPRDDSDGRGAQRLRAFDVLRLPDRQRAAVDDPGEAGDNRMPMTGVRFVRDCPRKVTTKIPSSPHHSAQLPSAAQPAPRVILRTAS